MFLLRGTLRRILQKILKKTNRGLRESNRRGYLCNKLCYMFLDVLSFDDIFDILMNSEKSNLRSKKLSIESLFKNPIVSRALRVLITNQNPIGFLSLLEKQILNASRENIAIIHDIMDDMINILRLDLLHDRDAQYSMKSIFKYLLEIVSIILKTLHNMKNWESIRVFSSKLTDLFEKQRHDVHFDYYTGKVSWRLYTEHSRRMWREERLIFSTKTARTIPTMAKEEIICLIENLSGTIGYIFFDFSDFIKTLVDSKDFVSITKILKILLDSITKQETPNISINVESEFMEFILHSIVSRLGYRDMLRFVDFCSRLAPSYQALIFMEILGHIVTRYIDNIPIGNDLREIRLLIEKLNDVISSDTSLMEKIRMYLEILKIRDYHDVNSYAQYPPLVVFKNNNKLYITLALLCIFEYMSKGSTWCKIVFNIESLERIRDVLERHVAYEVSFIRKMLIACLLVLSLLDNIASRKYSSLFKNLKHILRSLEIRLAKESIRLFGRGFEAANVVDIIVIIHRTLKSMAKKGILNLLFEYIKQQTYRIKEFMGEEVGMSYVMEYLIHRLTSPALAAGLFRDRDDVIPHVILAWSVVLLRGSTIIRRIISDAKTLSPDLRMYILKYLRQIVEIKVPILLDIFRNVSPRFSRHLVRPHHRRFTGPFPSRHARQHFLGKTTSLEELVEDSIIVGRIVESIVSKGKLDIDHDALLSILDASGYRKKKMLANSLYHAVIFLRVTDNPNIRQGILDIVDIIQANENVGLICGEYTDMSPEIILTFIKILVDAIKEGNNQYMGYLQRVLGRLSERTFIPPGSIKDVGKRVGELFNICYDLDPNLIECILHLIIQCFRKVKDSPEILIEPFIKTIGKKRITHLLDTLILNQKRLQIRPDLIDLVISILRCLDDKNLMMRYMKSIEDKESLLQSAILFGDRTLLSILDEQILPKSITKVIDTFLTKGRYMLLGVFPGPGIKRIRENIGFVVRRYCKGS